MKSSKSVSTLLDTISIQNFTIMDCYHHKKYMIDNNNNYKIPVVETTVSASTVTVVGLNPEIKGVKKAKVKDTTLVNISQKALLINSFNKIIDGANKAKAGLAQSNISAAKLGNQSSLRAQLDSINKKITSILDLIKNSGA